MPRYARRVIKKGSRKRAKYPYPRKPIPYLNSMGLGPSIVCKTRYMVQSNDINPGTVGTSSEVFISCNGLYDPEPAVGGNQPIGFDEMMAFYQKYTVLGAKITVDFMNLDGSNPQLVGIRIADDSAIITDVRRIIEQGRCVHTLLQSYQTGNAHKRMTMGVNPATFLGYGRPKNDDTLQGDDSNNPTSECFFGIFAAGQGAVDPNVCRVSAVVEYTVRYTEPRELVRS